MAYLEYFENNLSKKVLDINENIVGTCYSMCPTDEINVRKQEKLVHTLERKGQELVLVKSFSRSAAADTKTTLPHLLRPFSVLKKTVTYLLLEVTNRTDVPTLAVYEFVDDRLRSVRQDMTVQRLPDDECRQLLDPMIRFYLYYGYILNEEQNIRVLNKKFLLECLMSFLKCCDRQENDIWDSSFLNKIATLSLNHIDTTLPCDRSLMEALYILCNLEVVQPLHRYLNLPHKYKCHKTVMLAYNIAIANYTGNYVRVIRVAKQLGPLSYCAFRQYLPTLQRRILKVMSVAYNSKQLYVPSDVVCDLLWCDARQLVDLCKHYGVNLDNEQVRFCKGDFKSDAPLHRLKIHDPSFKNIFNDVSDTCNDEDTI